MLLSMVFDIAERLSGFIENKAPLSGVIFEYYMNFILYYGNTYSSMIIFIAVIWFTAKMAQETEIIPILNSGRPFNRFLRPYFLAATVLMLISLVINHFVLPRSNKVRLAFEEHYYRHYNHVSEYHAEFPGNEVVYFSYFTASDSLCRDFVLERWNDNDELEYFLKARSAKNRWNTKEWVLNDYYERFVIDGKDSLVHGRRKKVVYDFQVEDMAPRENVAETMTYMELKRFIKKERKKGSADIPRYETELYQRTSLPFAVYILTIIGVSVSSRKRRGGVGINIAFGLGIVFTYIFAMQVMAVAARNLGVPTVIAVWFPNILYAIIAYLLYRAAIR